MQSEHDFLEWVRGRIEFALVEQDYIWRSEALHEIEDAFEARTHGRDHEQCYLCDWYMSWLESSMVI